MALMKRGRFVEQHAGDQAGFLLTREFILEGNRLRRNTIVRGLKYRQIHVKVEVARGPTLGGHLDFSQPHEGFSLEYSDIIAADRADVLASWKGNADLSPLMGKPVYLRFELRNMGLVSFLVIKE